MRDGDVVVHGPHYEVHVHYQDEEAARVVLDLCERVWPRTMRLIDFDLDWEPEWQLGVHLYPNKERYAEVESWLTKGHFRDNESFSHWNTRTAHVSLAPPLPASAREHVRLSSQTREVLAHEAAHLAVYTVIPTYRWHPTWFGEGLAMWVEQEIAQELGLCGDPAEHPRFSTNQLLAKRILEENRLPTIEAILMDSVDRLHFNERYALWYEFFRVLRADEKKFDAVVSYLVDIRGGPAMRPKMAEFVKEQYGYEAIERELRRNIAALRPAWEQLYRSLDTGGEDWIQSAFPEFDAMAWRVEGAGEPGYSLEGFLAPLSAETEMNVLLDRSADGYVSVGFRPGEVSVHSYSPGQGWIRHASAAASELRVHGKTGFRVQTEEGEVRVFLEGEELLVAPITHRTLAGPWGLGVKRGGAGRWRALRLSR